MLFLVVAVLFGFTTADPTQPGCCVPPQWEGVEGSIIGMVRGGAASVTDTQTLISYDETNQMISANTYTEAAGQKINVKILQDFNKGMQYMINVDQKTCTGTPMPGPFTKVCLPADAELLGKIYFGIGDYIFDALSFRATVNNTRVTVVATREDCIPVLETLTGNFNEGNLSWL
ncbi:hypothetical protein SNE40_007651 [Patella caerulea]|uniref:Uncharacterized protein n=1 Tax=Patella caerulea TaxID=87958 RepID=A0AAN8K4Z8_PATCE